MPGQLFTQYFLTDSIRHTPEWQASGRQPQAFNDFADAVAGRFAAFSLYDMGEPAVPLILSRMQMQDGHWFEALQSITGANPVQSPDRGDVDAMQASWLEWGRQREYV